MVRNPQAEDDDDFVDMREKGVAVDKRPRKEASILEASSGFQSHFLYF